MIAERQGARHTSIVRPLRNGRHSNCSPRSIHSVITPVTTELLKMQLLNSCRSLTALFFGLRFYDQTETGRIRRNPPIPAASRPDRSVIVL